MIVRSLAALVALLVLNAPVAGAWLSARDVHVAEASVDTTWDGESLALLPGGGGHQLLLASAQHALRSVPRSARAAHAGLSPRPANGAPPAAAFVRLFRPKRPPRSAGGDDPSAH